MSSDLDSQLFESDGEATKPSTAQAALHVSSDGEVASPATTLPAPSAKSSTLYPKISGKLPDLQDAITKQASRTKPPRLLTQPIPFTGTIKLHGTHADILVHSSGEVVCQSRNRAVLTLEQDNLGFAAFCSARKAEIRLLVERVRQRWRNLHPDAQPEEAGDTVLIAGEWIGDGIQKGVAISQLPRQFVICSLRLAGTWQLIEAYADLSVTDAGILNISVGGFSHLSYTYSDEGEAFLAEAKKLTLAVAASCPFGATLGVSGSGEGLVWTPAAAAGLPNTPDFWLKTKAEHFHHSVHLRVVAEKATSQVEQRERARAFAARACTEGRLEQAWAYLLEMGIERSARGTGAFLGWLVSDIEVEERREIEGGRVGSSWKREVGKIAKPWYERMVKEDG